MTPPIVFIDTMLGFRITSGTAVVQLALIRSVYDTTVDPPKVVNIIQPTIDLAVPLPMLRSIVRTLSEELDRAEQRAAIPAHRGLQ